MSNILIPLSKAVRTISCDSVNDKCVMEGLNEAHITLTGSPFTDPPSVSPGLDQMCHLCQRPNDIQPPKENNGTLKPLAPSLRKSIFFGSYSGVTNDMIVDWRPMRDRWGVGWRSETIKVSWLSPRCLIYSQSAYYREVLGDSLSATYLDMQRTPRKTTSWKLQGSREHLIERIGFGR